MNTKKRIIGLAALVCLAILTTGCVTHTGRGAVHGAILGAGAGALIGHAAGDSGAGALIGAGAGLLLGGLIGSTIDAHEYRHGYRGGPHG